MRLGLTDMVGLAASLVFALPLANYALVRLFDGELALGAALLAVAAAMVVLPQYFLDPGRMLRGLAAGLLPRQLRVDPTRENGPRSDDAESDAGDDRRRGAREGDDAAER